MHTAGNSIEGWNVKLRRLIPKKSINSTSSLSIGWHTSFSLLYYHSWKFNGIGPTVAWRWIQHLLSSWLPFGVKKCIPLPSFWWPQQHMSSLGGSSCKLRTVPGSPTTFRCASSNMSWWQRTWRSLAIFAQMGSAQFLEHFPQSHCHHHHYDYNHHQRICHQHIVGILPTTQPLYLPLSFEVHLPTYLPTYYTTRLLQHPQGLMTISLPEEDLLNDRNKKKSKSSDTFAHSNFS